MSLKASNARAESRGKVTLHHWAHWFHAHFLWLLLGSYALAALVPQAGLTLRSLHIGSSHLPSVLLAILLFNAGMGFHLTALTAWRSWLKPLCIGTLSNIVLPVVLLVVSGRLLSFWHNPDEMQNILVGLALVASMPIAGSSTAWSQNAAGDVPLSLGLVLASTLVSPVATPSLLHFAGALTTGDYSEDLHELAQNGTSDFLIAYVLVPSLLGMLVTYVLGQTRSASARPVLKIVNWVVLLTLCYSNAAASLPQTIATPDWDFLFLVLFITTAFCVCLFLAGLWSSKWLRLPKRQQISLTFGLGMSNNGTGLVIATAALPGHPLVLLPMLFYNLVQHLVAGFIDRRFFSKDR